MIIMLGLDENLTTWNLSGKKKNLFFGVENHYTLSLVQDLVNETLLVSEIEISQAIRYVFESQRMVLGVGAEVGTAVLLSKNL